jgi:hypothetical protein
VNTFILAGAALLFSLAIADTARASGPHCARAAASDYLVNLVAFAGISVPSFWIAIVLILVFAVYDTDLPGRRHQQHRVRHDAMGDIHGSRAAPRVASAVAVVPVSIGTYVRYTRAAMIEAMSSDYIRTAKAKGLSRDRILLMHGFRNALNPLITIVALSFSTLFSGAIITETVFAYRRRRPAGVSVDSGQRLQCRDDRVHDLGVDGAADEPRRRPAVRRGRPADHLRMSELTTPTEADARRGQKGALPRSAAHVEDRAQPVRRAPDGRGRPARDRAVPGNRAARTGDLDGHWSRSRIVRTCSIAISHY